MAKVAKKAIVTVDLPSVLGTTVRERQTLKDAFQSELEGVLKGHTGGGANTIWNVGRVATEVVVIAGSGRTHGSKRGAAKKAAKKTAKK